MTHNFGDSKIKAIAVDVRGTLIDPYEDWPITVEMADNILRLAANKVSIGVISATSLTSLKTLFIPPLLMSLGIQKHPWSILDNIIMYVDSGTAAYWLHPDGSTPPINDYTFLTFEQRHLNAINSALSLASNEFSWAEPTRKDKPGQVNYYCGGNWKSRRKLADFLCQYFISHRINDIYVMVPSAKDTIDIALCNKKKPTSDLLARVGCHSEDVLILGDSLQLGGADADMMQISNSTHAFQVGPITPSEGVHYLEGYGPEGALKVLKGISL